MRLLREPIWMALVWEPFEDLGAQGDPSGAGRYGLGVRARGRAGLFQPIRRTGKASGSGLWERRRPPTTDGGSA